MREAAGEVVIKGNSRPHREGSEVKIHPSKVPRVANETVKVDQMFQSAENEVGPKLQNYC